MVERERGREFGGGEFGDGWFFENFWGGFMGKV